MITQLLAHSLPALAVLALALALIMSAQKSGGLGLFGQLMPSVAAPGRVGHTGREHGYVKAWKQPTHDQQGPMHIEATPAAQGGGGGGGASTKSADEQILEILPEIRSKLGKVDALEKSLGEGKKTNEEFAKTIAEIQQALIDIRKIGLASRGLSRREGFVSDECARYLGGIYIAAGLRQEKFEELPERKALLTKKVQDLLGADHKAALTTSDIPLPTQYSGEVVELVSTYGFARRFGTVFPLGSGVVKLPRLGTDTAFGLISASGTVTEKSPTVVFVTFTPEKTGGLVRLPSEIDEDSIVAMGQFLARYCARQMAKAEDTLFFMGDGSTQGAVAGLAFSTITNSKVNQMASTKTHYSDATLAYFRGIRALVDAPVLGQAAYHLHPTFEQLLSSFNTAGDKPYIANGVNGASLDGYPIKWVDVMPAYSTSANVSKVFVLFGDVSYQYLGVRGQLRFDTSKEAGFTTDEILIRALERFTIGLMATGAVSGLETAAS